METMTNISVQSEGENGQTAPLQRNLNGLGGWLILVGIGLVFAPFRMLVQLVPMYIEMFQNDYWKMLMTEGSPYYDPTAVTLVSVELSVNVTIFIWTLFLIYLFFSKKKIFPRSFIYLTVFSFLFLVIDTIFGHFISPTADVFFNGGVIVELIRATLPVVIWVPYMKMSKRVEQTFVR